MFCTTTCIFPQWKSLGFACGIHQFSCLVVPPACGEISASRVTSRGQRPTVTWIYSRTDPGSVVSCLSRCCPKLHMLLLICPPLPPAWASLPAPKCVNLHISPYTPPPSLSAWAGLFLKSCPLAQLSLVDCVSSPLTSLPPTVTWGSLYLSFSVNLPPQA